MIVHKLEPTFDEFDYDPWFENLSMCGEPQGYMECPRCDHFQPMAYKCGQKWCPRCQWKITAKRKATLNLWSMHIRNPMHLVLTQRNFPDLDGRKLREHTKNLAKIRRHDVMENVKGGCISVEITNEDKGWHLHSHWLIDASFVDIKVVAQAWGKLVGQEYAIVKFNNDRTKSYVAEVCKYVAKGSEVAGWDGETIREYIEAIRGRRFFFAFGSYFKNRPPLAEEKSSFCECPKCNEQLHPRIPKKK